MSKFQQFLEFETHVATRAPQQPSESFLARERAFSQQADRIAKLREVRLAAASSEDGGSGRGASRPAVYEVVRQRGFWRVLHLGKHSPSCPSQQAAIEAAVKQAKKAMALGQLVEVRLKRTDGDVWAIDMETGTVVAPPDTAKS